MKKILIVAAALFLIGCSSAREIQQVDMVKAQLVKVDTVYRFTGNVKQLTWQDQDEIKYVSYVSLTNEIHRLGASVFVMRKK